MKMIVLAVLYTQAVVDFSGMLKIAGTSLYLRSRIDLLVSRNGAVKT